MPFNLSLKSLEAGLVPVGAHTALIADVTPTDGEEQYLGVVYQILDADDKFLRTFDLIGAAESSPRFNEAGKGMKFAISLVQAVGADPEAITEVDDFVETLLGQKVTVMVAHRGKNPKTAVIKSVLALKTAEPPASKTNQKTAAAAE
jgi:hypothetical protein